MFDIKKAILEAEARIRPYVRKTPLERSEALSKTLKNQVFLKYENYQITGAFKVRGAMNKLLSLTPDQSERGIVTASSGNHGAAVAYGLNQLNQRGVIFVPAESIKAGHILDMETQETLSDATAGGIEPNAITFDLCKKYVDDYCLVSEEEIKQALILVIKTQHILIEGAAAVALAGFLQYSPAWTHQNMVVVLSGANINISTLTQILT